MQAKLSPRTRRNIRKVIKLLTEDRDLTNQQLADKMRMCLSSISRLKKLAVEHGYTNTQNIASTKYLQYFQNNKTGTQLTLDFGEPQTPPSEPVSSVPDAVAVDLTATAVAVSDTPLGSGEVSPTHVAVATIMRKLASVIAGNNHPDIWRDISAYAQLMLAQSKAMERVENLKDKQ